MTNAELLDAIVQTEAIRKATASDSAKTMYEQHLRKLLEIQVKRASLVQAAIPTSATPETPEA